MELRKLTESEVKFILSIEEEDQPLKGAFDSGDKKADEELIQSLQKRLAQGDVLAWFVAKVEATWTSSTGQEFKGVNYLGGNSYDSEEEFRKDSHFEDMKSEALNNLQEGLEKIFSALSELVPTESQKLYPEVELLRSKGWIPMVSCLSGETRWQDRAGLIWTQEQALGLVKGA